MSPVPIRPEDVQETLARHLLLDGFPLVVDLEGSRGSRFRDRVTGREFLDFYMFFSSSPLGFNHPRLRDPAFLDRLVRASIHKPANSDLMTVEMAEFVETFARIAMEPGMPHLFFVEGGALAVENAMKAAFDWKVRKNLERGIEPGDTKVLHFREAFHGRSGYTLSVTNTAPVKTMYYPKFRDWPRVSNPKIRFPLTPESIAEVEAAEARAVAEIEAAFDADPHGIAAILIEPVQCEGGDNHFRGEFLRELRRIADEREAMLIFDEVQTGVGTTGEMWAFRHFGVVPDMVAFAKKMQVGGFMCGRRIEEVPDHVFAVSSRINSTWGGGLTDMVRATEILDIIRDEGLVENAGAMGRRLRDGLAETAEEFPGRMTNVRGLGLLVAFDLPDSRIRDAAHRACFDEGLLALKCGERSIRLRPALNVTAEDIDEGIRRIHRALRVTSRGGSGL